MVVMMVESSEYWMAVRMEVWWVELMAVLLELK